MMRGDWGPNTSVPWGRWDAWDALGLLRETVAVTLDVGRRFGLLCGNPSPLYSASFYRLHNLGEVGLCVSSSLLMGLRRNSVLPSLCPTCRVLLHKVSIRAWSTPVPPLIPASVRAPVNTEANPQREEIRPHGQPLPTPSAGSSGWGGGAHRWF